MPITINDCGKCGSVATSKLEMRLLVKDGMTILKPWLILKCSSLACDVRIERTIDFDPIEQVIHIWNVTNLRANLAFHGFIPPIYSGGNEDADNDQ